MSGTAGMERRRLGRAGPEVSAIGLGCMSLSGVYGPSDDEGGVRLIHRAIELGVDHFDSSDMYGWGQNEELRGRHPRFSPENFAKNRELVQHIEAIAEEKDCTPAQLVLAWLLGQGPDVIPIPGTKHPNRLEENLGALSVSLTPAEIDRISQAIPIGAAAGTRYPEGGMRGVYI